MITFEDGVGGDSQQPKILNLQKHFKITKK